MKYIPLLFFFFLSTLLLGQNQLRPEKIAVDDSLGLAILHRSAVDSLTDIYEFTHANQGYKHTHQTSCLQNHIVHQFIDTQGNRLNTYYTSLPLIQIDAPLGIVNEPKRLSRIQYADSDTTFTAYAGIELRGSSSLAFPKKTYDLNFYTDSTARKNLDVRLAGMRKDDDWILDGLYNEPLRMRSFLSLNLWNEIYHPYYLDREPKAKAGAQGVYAEVFVNGSYQGVFLLQEQVDRKLTQVVKIKDDEIRGEIFQGARYLGAVTFDSIPQKKNYLPSWGGYDIKYPVPTNVYWDNVYPFTDFVVNSADSAFAKAISSTFYLENAIDYFLFVNALRAPDNLGKNLYLIRYDVDEPYFYAPWDLDGSFGTIFSGKRIPTTNDFLSNGLLRRLISTNADGFVERFQQRWEVLRTGIFSNDAILNRQKEAYEKLLNEGVFEREAMRWNDFVYDREGLEYMQQWTLDRMQFLDTYIAAIAITKQ